MALYQYSWLILLAPLFAFAVIIFGTRVWDMLSRPHATTEQGDAMVSHGGHGTEVTSQAEAHAVDAHGEDHGENHLDDDEDPKVAYLTMGAKASGYVAIAI